MKELRIVHKRSAPYHPATNGQVERYVQTIKNKLKALNANKTNLQENLDKILTQYRNTKHPVTNKSPSEILFTYPVKTIVSTLFKQSKFKNFVVGERVAARNYFGQPKWKFGRIKKI